MCFRLFFFIVYGGPKGVSILLLPLVGEEVAVGYDLSVEEFSLMGLIVWLPRFVRAMVGFSLSFAGSNPAVTIICGKLFVEDILLFLL